MDSNQNPNTEVGHPVEGEIVPQSTEVEEPSTAVVEVLTPDPDTHIPMTAKEMYHEKILEILSNPEEEVPNRKELAEKLNISRRGLYDHFTGKEVDELYRTALKIRRERLSSLSVHVDDALYQQALSGDVKAIELWYKRLEGWSPTSKLEADVKLSLVERLIQVERGKQLEEE